MPSPLAHILDPRNGYSGWWLLAGLVGLTLLIAQHHFVAGFSRRELSRRARAAVAIALVLALSALVAPTGDARQSSASLLPDLISDPPRPSFLNEITTSVGETRLVVTFDGYVHNIGEGALDVVGNPQLPDGMKQRVFNGSTWEEVGSPTVRFETDDGHNHFHLIEAIEYVLWNELQGAQAAIGSKVGFCLVDSEQIEPGAEQDYSEEGDKFCQEDTPDATELRMGISSGWRDIYDATTTLQWVDVSNVAPGRYWIGAITDPNDEILESNEDNNALIFSTETFSVPGFAPREQPTIQVDDSVVEITLSSWPHGTVTAPIYVVEQGPSQGSLDVPVGAALRSPVLRYFPDPEAVGPDEIVFSVRDASSPYPLEAPTQRLALEIEPGIVSEEETETVDLGQSTVPLLVAPSTFFETSAGERSVVEIEVSDATGNPASLFAEGLPAGLSANAATGIIEGIALEEGIFNVVLSAVGSTPDEVITTEVTWIVNPATAASGLLDVADLSSPRGELARLRAGANVLGAVFEAEGLPPGINLDELAPVLLGSPTETGTYAVTLRQIEDGDVVGESSFEWTVRSTTDINFAL